MTVLQDRPILIMAGGTGGHVFPALAVARELMARDIPVVWMGTRQGLEARVVPEAGIPMEWISVSGLRGKRFSKWILAPFMLLGAAWQAMRVLLRRNPRAVLGMGGFVTGPGGVMARLLGKPLCIHEQNAIAGMTNRWLSRIANRVMEAFPGSLPANRKAILTGNPVRVDIASLPLPEQRIGRHPGTAHVLVLGGSLGAQALNEVLPQALGKLPASLRPSVRHQAGVKNLQQAQALYRDAGILDQVEVLPFVEDMAQAYAWADLVICRAGALTIAELTAAGVGSVLVPYPYAVDDHQTRNAEYLVRSGAAILVPQTKLDADSLAGLLTQLLDDRERLLAMAQAARALAQPDASRSVADICLQACGERSMPAGGAR